MRYMLLLILLGAAAGCNSVPGSKQAANEEYAVDSYEQSLAAYQLCASQHADEPSACGALARVMEADKKRYEKTKPGL